MFEFEWWIDVAAQLNHRPKNSLNVQKRDRNLCRSGVFKAVQFFKSTCCNPNSAAHRDRRPTRKQEHWSAFRAGDARRGLWFGLLTSAADWLTFALQRERERERSRECWVLLFVCQNWRKKKKVFHEFTVREGKKKQHPSRRRYCVISSTVDLKVPSSPHSFLSLRFPFCLSNSPPCSVNVFTPQTEAGWLKNNNKKEKNPCSSLKE